MPFSPEAVLEYVRANGPCQPNEIRQALQAQDNFVVGAVLSELLGAGKIALSSLSLGTSRFYYDPDQPVMLEKISQHLNEKDQRAYTVLREQRVVRAHDLTPILRVAMSNIPDYSRPLLVRHDDGTEEQFWHYYLLSAQDAFTLIKERYFGEKPKREAPSSEHADAPEIERETNSVASSPATAKKRVPQRPKPAPKAHQDVEAGAGALLSDLGLGFGAQVQTYFDQKQIAVVRSVETKKTEVSALVRVPSAVGPVSYYCKAKQKKICTDGDLASAMLEARQHSLPLLFIAGGSISKKAATVAATQGLVVVQPWV